LRPRLIVSLEAGSNVISIGSNFRGRAGFITETNIWREQRGSHLSRLAHFPARREGDVIRAQTDKEVSHDTGSPRGGDDDQQRIGAWGLTSDHAKSSPLELAGRVAARAIQHARLRPESRPVGRCQGGVQRIARERANDMIRYGGYGIMGR
jgi:hypothetical protein